MGGEKRTKKFAFCEVEGQPFNSCKSEWKDVIGFAFTKIKMVAMWMLDSRKGLNSCLGTINSSSGGK